MVFPVQRFPDRLSRSRTVFEARCAPRLAAGGALTVLVLTILVLPRVGAADRVDRVLPTVVVRSTPTEDLGLATPSGLAFVPGEGIVVSGAPGSNGQRSALSWTTADEDEVAPLAVPNLTQPATLTYDQKNGRFIGADPNGAVVATRQSRNSGPSSRRQLPPNALAGARASAVDPSTGAWYVVIGDDLLRVPNVDGAPSTPERVKLKGGIKPSGLAFNPADGLLYAYDGNKREVVVVAADGSVSASYDLSAAKLDDVRGMAFAPSADATDSATTFNLFVADAGGAASRGAVVEAALVAAPLAAAATPATLRRTVNTSSFNPPAPDASGIAFLGAEGNLLIADSEVDEMAIFRGANLFRSTRSGSLVSTGLTNPPTREPTGLAHDGTTNTLYVSDDDRDRVYFDQPGPDGRHGTGDDTWGSIRTDLYGGNDAEDVGYDPVSRDLFQVDGTNREVYRVGRGPNGVFDGVSPVGDDTVSQFDLAQYGAVDPEGIHYDTARQMLFVIDEGSAAIYRLSPAGALLAVIDISAINTTFAADVVIAPASATSGDSLYIVDRGVDNNVQPTENDGRMFELGADLGGAQNQPPSVNAGPRPDGGLANGATAGRPGQRRRVAGQLAVGELDPDERAGHQPRSPTQAAATSAATFSAAGSYVLRLTASDTSLSAFDDVVVTVQAAGRQSTWTSQSPPATMMPRSSPTARWCARVLT